jgi:hypothetical protein
MKQRRRGRVSIMMKNLIVVLAIAACRHKQPAPVSNQGSAEDPPGVVTDTRTELEKRRDGACETLGPKITACAVEDAKRGLAAGRVKQKDFDATTAPEVQRKNTEEFIEQCRKNPFSSRQVRVLEVCQQEESQCEPLLACLDNLNKQ